MKSKIIKQNAADEFYTTEKCFIIDASNSDDDKFMSIACARVEPGITTRWHYLEGVDERYLIISGSGKVEVGDLEPEIVKTGDIVLIPAGIRQRITNIADNDLIFYCVCTPRFTHDCYRDVEND
jgi:mannose-6-phosphate isomerase-like protein (cupin superfamily)